MTTEDAQMDGQPDVAAMSFEEALAALEEVVSRLEGAEVALEASIALYKRGAALRQHCEARLKAAELEVSRIVADGEGVALVPENTPKSAPAPSPRAPAAPDTPETDDIPF